MNKIISTICLYLFIISPAMAVQHWLHAVGYAHTDALGVAVVTGGKSPGKQWTVATNRAVRKWSNQSDINPFKQTEGFENITVLQDPDAWKCDHEGIACTSVDGGSKQGIDRVCTINIDPFFNSLPKKYKTMSMLHEIGHCYSLDHNDRYDVDGNIMEEIEVSEGELMHPSGCPGASHICETTTQALDVINHAY